MDVESYLNRDLSILANRFPKCWQLSKSAVLFWGGGKLLEIFPPWPRTMRYNCEQCRRVTLHSAAFCTAQPIGELSCCFCRIPVVNHSSVICLKCKCKTARNDFIGATRRSAANIHTPVQQPTKHGETLYHPKWKSVQAFCMSSVVILRRTVAD